MSSIAIPDVFAVLHVVMFLTVYVPLCAIVDKHAKKRTRR